MKTRLARKKPRNAKKQSLPAKSPAPDRRWLVVGVVCAVAGFVASLFMRGQATVLWLRILEASSGALVLFLISAGLFQVRHLVRRRVDDLTVAVAAFYAGTLALGAYFNLVWARILVFPLMVAPFLVTSFSSLLVRVSRLEAATVFLLGSHVLFDGLVAAWVYLEIRQRRRLLRRVLLITIFLILLVGTYSCMRNLASSSVP